jgi:integrase/recombinase XerC
VITAGDASDGGALDADIARHLEYLKVERRLAERTLAMYGDAFARLQRFAAATPVALRAAETHHVRRWAAQLHGGGLAPRSIALVLSAWRGFYRWLGRDGRVAANPVAGVRAPRAPQPLPKALAVDHAVALVQHRSDSGDRRRAARDASIAELV